MDEFSQTSNRCRKLKEMEGLSLSSFLLPHVLMTQTYVLQGQKLPLVVVLRSHGSYHKAIFWQFCSFVKSSYCCFRREISSSLPTHIVYREQSLFNKTLYQLPDTNIMRNELNMHFKIIFHFSSCEDENVFSTFFHLSL